MPDENENVESAEDEQTPLLPSANQAARRVPTTRKLENNGRTCRILMLIIVIIFLVFVGIPLLISLLGMIWPCDWWPNPPYGYNCPHPPFERERPRPEPIPPPLLPPPTCPDPHFTQTSDHEFDAIWSMELHEEILIPNVRSKVHIIGGDYSQKADVIVKVQVDATSANDVPRIRVFQDPNRHRLIIASSDQEYADSLQDQKPFDGCGAVLITMYIKPGLNLGRSLRVQTHRAAIEMGYNLHFTSSSTVFSSLHGDIASIRAYDHDRLYSPSLRSLQISTQHNGSIFGRWPISTETALHTVDGNVQVRLVAEYSSSYWDPTNLNISTSAGDIDVHLSSFMTSPYHVGPSVRAYNTSITSNSGDIIGNLGHGVKTTLITNEGMIEVVLTPNNLYERLKSQITTKSPRGSTSVRILEPISPRYPYNIDPVMAKTKSLHEAGTKGSGSLWLVYPVEWTGHLNGSVMDGTIVLRGSVDDDLDNESDARSADGSIKVSNGTVERRRGDGSSELKFEVGKGNAVVDVGAYVFPG
jgi:hypothetical protein